MDALAEVCSYNVSTCEVFASEAPGRAGDPQRRWLANNCQPLILYEDMCRRQMTGLNMLNGEVATTPTVPLYVAGWVCKDVAAMNTLGRKRLDSVLRPTSGASTKTLHASLFYISTFQPAVVIVENVYNRKNIEVAVALLLKLKVCLVRSFVINSRPALS